MFGFCLTSNYEEVVSESLRQRPNLKCVPPKGIKFPTLIIFSGDENPFTVDYIAGFTSQCVDVRKNEGLKLHLLVLQ